MFESSLPDSRIGENLMTDQLLWSQAERLLAGGFQTLSKNPNRYPDGVAPKFLSHGRGAYVWDLHGKKYVDLVAGLGPILLGHCDSAVDNAVIEQVRRGASFTLGTRIEVEVAELITSMVPSVEMVRFAKNGKDVNEAACRLARFETGRKHMIYCGYAGGFDNYLSTTDNDGGVMDILKQYNHQVRWADSEQISKIIDLCHLDGGIAGMMIEVPPPIYACSVSDKNYGEFLKFLELLCRENGIVFILDEVVTGWRKALGGAQAYYGIKPDLSCFSKAMGNGYSISAIGGRSDLMKHFGNGKVFLSTTFGGETIGLTAASVVLSAIGYTTAWDHLKLMGNKLADGLFDLMKYYRTPAVLTGDHSRVLIKFEDVNGVSKFELQTLWQQCMIERGVLAGSPIFPMVCYTDEIVQEILFAASDSFDTISEALNSGDFLKYLKCIPIEDSHLKRYQTSREMKSQMVW